MPEKLTQLFQPFNRPGQELSAIAGAGIGLVLTKQREELMDRVLGIESTAGVGSLFWVALNSTPEPDLSRGDLEIIAPAQLDQPDAVLKRAVLYVEDSPENMKSVEPLIARYQRNRGA